MSTPRLTIGLPCAQDYEGVWFTLQSLRLYQDLEDTELLVVDNAGDDRLRDLVQGWLPDVRYVRWLERRGTAPAKQRVFEEARGDWVLCMDAHVLLVPGAVARLRAWTEAHPDCRDLLHGPLLYDDHKTCADAMNPEWRGGMWGTWRHATVSPELEPYEIPMHGMGVFGCRRDAWLGFHPAFRGFGGEEGYIHEKYRKAGRRALLLPFLRWNHFFRPGPPPYPLQLEDRIHNYEVGFAELGLDPAPMRQHFGREPGRPA